MDRTREDVKSDLNALHDYHAEHPDRDPTGTALLYSAQKLTIEVLLDIRDILRRIEKDMGVEKWGSKL